MMGMDLFIAISVFLYILVFFIMPKIGLPDIVEILIAGYIGGSYLNIADKGNVVNWLSIELTDTIRVISMIIVFIYFVSMWFFIIKSQISKTS